MLIKADIMSFIQSSSCVCVCVSVFYLGTLLSNVQSCLFLFVIMVVYR